jgi:hypothetical protein
MTCERLKVFGVAGEHATARFRHGDDDRINGGTVVGAKAQQGGAPCNRFRQIGDDVAGLEEPVGVRIGTRTTGDGFDDNGRRYERRPQPVASEDSDDRGILPVPSCQSRNCAAVEDEHRSAGSFGDVVGLESTSDRLGSSDLVRCGFADFVEQFAEVAVGLVEQRLATEFGAHGLLEKL